MVQSILIYLYCMDIFAMIQVRSSELSLLTRKTVNSTVCFWIFMPTDTCLLFGKVVLHKDTNSNDNNISKNTK